MEQMDIKKSGIKGPLTKAGGIKTTNIEQKFIKFKFLNLK